MLGTAVPLTQQNETGQRRSGTREDLTEVGIGGDENPALAPRQLKDFLIDVASEAAILYMGHVVANSGQERDDPCANALVYQELHAGVRSGS